MAYSQIKQVSVCAITNETRCAPQRSEKRCCKLKSKNYSSAVYSLTTLPHVSPSKAFLNGATHFMTQHPVLDPPILNLIYFSIFSFNDLTPELELYYTASVSNRKNSIALLLDII